MDRPKPITIVLSLLKMKKMQSAGILEEGGHVYGEFEREKMKHSTQKPVLMNFGQKLTP